MAVIRCRFYSIQKVLEYFPFKQKHFQKKKNVHCNIVKHTTKPHLMGAIENINTIDDYRPKIVRIIVFLLPSLIKQATLCNQNTVSSEF